MAKCPLRFGRWTKTHSLAREALQLDPNAFPSACNAHVGPSKNPLSRANARPHRWRVHDEQEHRVAARGQLQI